MFGGIGMPELIVILVIALIFFGPGKLPEMGSMIGKAIRGFKKAMDEPEEKSGNTSESKKEDRRKETFLVYCAMTDHQMGLSMVD
jgi:sec-independent protein translocase protein TatA